MKPGQPLLVVTSALVLVAIAAVGLVGWNQLRTTARAYESLVDQEARLTKGAVEMRVAVDDQAVGVRGFLLSRGDRRFLQPYLDGTEAFAGGLRAARSSANDSSHLRSLERIEALHEELQPIYRREIALARDGRLDEAARLAQRRSIERRDALVASLDALVSAEAERLYRERTQAGDIQRTAEMAILGVLGLALTAGGVAAALAIRTMRRDRGASAEIDAARRQAAEEAALARIATAIANEEQPSAVLESAAEEAAGLLGVASATILRLEEGSRSALVVGAAGDGGLVPGDRLAVGDDDAVGRCLSAERPTTTSARHAAGGVRMPLHSSGAGEEIAVPISVGARAWGAICVASAPAEPLPANAEDRLLRFAQLASASITGADARSHLAQLALEDSLTGLANHRHFHERVRAEVARAQRHGRALSLVLFDLDHFKDVNDSHGHHVGDLVLRETARRLAGCARSGELVARVGGEQFGWILPEAGGLDAFQAAERARRILAATPMGDGLRITASAGVCDLERASSTGELLRFADGALFWAKAHGRDITFRYSPDVVTELSAAEQLEHLRRTRTIVGIRALARAVDVKDRSTARHSERVAEIAVALAAAMGWDEQELAFLHEAALVHDVGKIGVPDAILLKPTTLDPAEYEVIKGHAALSAEIVDDVLSEEQVSWVLGHHERLDGRGYPSGLAGSDLPVGARILAMADAWDVMTSERPYSPARTKEDALAEVRDQAGRQFCPDVVRALETVIAEEKAAGVRGSDLTL
jgi:diguanylate cyclase (GGDEF)-like protein